MKALIIGLLSIIFRTSIQFNPCPSESFIFANEKWTFPSTVEDAFNRHKLFYKPPGFYYRSDSANIRVILSYHFNPLDFDDEYQPKEVLFPRQLHSYVFQIKESSATYDSLKLEIERTHKKKFKLVKGLKDGSTIQEKDRPFAYQMLKIDDCLTVGIKRGSSDLLGKIVTVRYMYNLPLGEMGTAMGNY